MVNARIVGWGHYVPERVVSNAYFVALNPLFEYNEEGERVKEMDTSDAWIQQMMGVRERRRAASDEEVHHMGAKAVLSALQKTDFQPEDLEGIIVGTVTQDKQFPSAACQMRELIGARNANRCFDVGAACSGFTTALDIANAFIKQGSGPLAVVGVEKLSRMADDRDKNAPLYSGDGAGAVILYQTPYQNQGILTTYSITKTEDNRLQWIHRDKNRILRMPHGGKVLVEATRELEKACRTMTRDVGWKIEDVDQAIFHQANIRILDNVKERLELREDQVYMNIQKYGNLSAASAPIAYSEACDAGLIKADAKVLIACIGSGMVIGGAALVA